MNQAGVWSFRTTTGVARVVDGSLRKRGTLRGFIVGTRKQFRSGSILRHIGLTVGSVGAVGPIRDVVESVLAEGLIAGAVSAGLGALLIMIGTAVVWTSLTWSLFGRSETVDIYDITDVTADPEDCELTIQHTDETGGRETTTVEVYDADELGEAVEILQLKGAPLNEATADLYDRG